MEDKIRDILSKMEWLGHDTFKISDDIVIYTDPYQLKDDLEEADLILVTHAHFDHLSLEDIEKVCKEDTAIVGPPDCIEKCPDLIPIRIGEEKTVKGVKIKAVPSYNIGKDFHPKSKGWVGYIFTVDDIRIYLAGDTDNIPEMEVFDVDIALLPVSGTYVMTAEEAIDAALKINPKVAIPMHYGAIVGSKSDAEKFKEALEGKIEVHIFE